MPPLPTPTPHDRLMSIPVLNPQSILSCPLLFSSPFPLLVPFCHPLPVLLDKARTAHSKASPSGATRSQILRLAPRHRPREDSEGEGSGNAEPSSSRSPERTLDPSLNTKHMTEGERKESTGWKLPIPLPPSFPPPCPPASCFPLLPFYHWVALATCSLLDLGLPNLPHYIIHLIY